MTFHAQTVAQCWRIARRLTIAYQREFNRAKMSGHKIQCLAARDAADRVAMTIRYGPGRGKRRMPVTP